MTSERPSVTALRAAPTLWYAVALNLAALLVTVIAVAFTGTLWPVLILVVTLGSSAATGAVCLVRRETRPFGVGCLGGAAVSALVILVLFVIFFVTYFVVPGGHELS